MNILLIEDNHYKIDQLLDFLSENFAKANVVVAKSYHRALQEVQSGVSYDLILLDISMPTYDIQAGEPGGDPLPRAGSNILNEMYLRDINSNVIVVTMYENFVDGTQLLALDKEFQSEYSENYRGYVYFSPGDINWKEILKKKMNDII